MTTELSAEFLAFSNRALLASLIAREYSEVRWQLLGDDDSVLVNCWPAAEQECQYEIPGKPVVGGTLTEAIQVAAAIQAVRQAESRESLERRGVDRVRDMLKSAR